MLLPVANPKPPEAAKKEKKRKGRVTKMRTRTRRGVAKKERSLENQDNRRKRKGKGAPSSLFVESLVKLKIWANQKIGVDIPNELIKTPGSVYQRISICFGDYFGFFENVQVILL